jgi:hypothetical protein
MVNNNLVLPNRSALTGWLRNAGLEPESIYQQDAGNGRRHVGGKGQEDARRSLSRAWFGTGGGRLSRLACGVVTATKNPGDRSPSNRVIGSPKPQFLSRFFTKCHISSRVTTTTSALVDGSGSLRASSRTQFRTATSLTPRMRAMEPKLTLPTA